MPAYVYKCKTCDFTYEKKKKFSDPHDIACPQVDCDGEVRRVINSVGIVFKGSGFYVNDSRSNNPAAPAAKSENGDGSKSNDKGASNDGESVGAKKADSADSSSKSKPKSDNSSKPKPQKQGAIAS